MGRRLETESLAESGTKQGSHDAEAVAFWGPGRYRCCCCCCRDETPGQRSRGTELITPREGHAPSSDCRQRRLVNAPTCCTGFLCAGLTTYVRTYVRTVKVRAYSHGEQQPAPPTTIITGGRSHRSRTAVKPGWLNGFNTELSPKRYWRGPRSQEVGEEEDYTYAAKVTTGMTAALRRAVTRAAKCPLDLHFCS